MGLRKCTSCLTWASKIVIWLENSLKIICEVRKICSSDLRLSTIIVIISVRLIISWRKSCFSLQFMNGAQQGPPGPLHSLSSAGVFSFMSILLCSVLRNFRKGWFRKKHILSSWVHFLLISGDYKAKWTGILMKPSKNDYNLGYHYRMSQG